MRCQIRQKLYVRGKESARHIAVHGTQESRICKLSRAPSRRVDAPVSSGSYRREAVGLNQIFGHREDEHVQHDTVILAEIPRVPKVPDAIFGLRHTRNIENLLNDAAQIGVDKAKVKPWFKSS
jgi:hypothetical protein